MSYAGSRCGKGRPAEIGDHRLRSIPLPSARGALLKCEFPCRLLGQIGGFSSAPGIDAPKRIFGFRSDHHSRHLTFAVTEDGRKTDSSRLPHSVNVTPADFWHVRRRRVNIAGESIVQAVFEISFGSWGICYFHGHDINPAKVSGSL